MYTSAVFLGKKKQKKMEESLLSSSLLLSQEMFSMKNYQDQRMDITKNPI